MKQIFLVPTETTKIEMPEGLFNSISPKGIPQQREFKVIYQEDFQFAIIHIDLNSSETAEILKLSGAELLDLEFI